MKPTLKLETLVTLRRCKDGLKHSGGLANFEVTKEILAAVKRSRKDLKSKEKTAEKECKKRRNVGLISTVTAKIKRLAYEAQYLLDLADKKGVEAEKTACFKAMAESNVLRMSAKDKKERADVARHELNKFNCFKFI